MKHPLPLTSPAAVVLLVQFRPRCNQRPHQGLPVGLVPGGIHERGPAVEILGVYRRPRREQQEDGVHGAFEGGQVQQAQAPGVAVRPCRVAESADYFAFLKCAGVVAVAVFFVRIFCCSLNRGDVKRSAQ